MTTPRTSLPTEEPLPRTLALLALHTECCRLCRPEQGKLCPTAALILRGQA